MTSTKKELPPCPVAVTLELIGNKWKIFILRDLLSGTKRFGALRQSVAGISQKVLTQNLRDMEKNGLIIRKIYAQIPPKVEYSLTQRGKSLRPVIAALALWGKKYQKAHKNKSV